MSAFDDEFGLFGEEARRRRTASDARRSQDRAGRNDHRRHRAAKMPSPPGGASSDRNRQDARGGGGSRRPGAYRGVARPRDRQPSDPWAAQRRASELLDFFAQQARSPSPRASRSNSSSTKSSSRSSNWSWIREDLGKVIGRSGRVAQALRTLVRATAEGRVCGRYSRQRRSGAIEDEGDGASE